MKFITFEKDGYLEVDFPDETGSKKQLLTCFLEDSRNYTEGYLKGIDEAEKSGKEVTGFTGNRVDVEFYPDRAVIEELYPADEDNFQKIEIPLQEAKNLLLDWKDVIEKWKSRTANV